MTNMWDRRAWWALCIVMHAVLDACTADPLHGRDGGDPGDSAFDAGDSGAPMNTCGDGVTQATEACDDGNRQDGDGCSWNCSAITPYCGDGIVQPPEACDVPHDSGAPPSYFGYCTGSCRSRIGVSCGLSTDEDAGGVTGCRETGESGINPALDITRLEPSHWMTLCQWLNGVKAAQPDSVQCSTFNYVPTPEPCELFDPTPLNTDVGYDPTCGISVFEFERCMRRIAQSPCASIVVEGTRFRYDPACFEAACAN